MLREKITESLKDAMRAKDEARTGAIRLIIAKMKEKDIEARPKGNANGIGDDELMAMMQGMIKQRRESIDLYQKGNRQDLVDKEQSEINVIESFLPAQMDEAAMTTAIQKIMDALGAKDIKDMGKVMGEAKKTYAGQMDFTAASALIKKLLTAA
jgi:uncharacterized protein